MESKSERAYYKEVPRKSANLNGSKCRIHIGLMGDAVVCNGRKLFITAGHHSRFKTLKRHNLLVVNEASVRSTRTNMSTRYCTMHTWSNLTLPKLVFLCMQKRWFSFDAYWGCQNKCQSSQWWTRSVTVAVSQFYLKAQFWRSCEQRQCFYRVFHPILQSSTKHCIIRLTPVLLWLTRRTSEERMKK